MPHFDNPNNPTQLIHGVYGWYIAPMNQKKYIYIGSSGNRPTTTTRGTLLRATMHLSKSPKWNKSGHLNTNFIVGSVIDSIEAKGLSCHWEHFINSTAGQEKYYVEQEKPLLQESNGTIKQAYRTALENEDKKHFLRLIDTILEQYNRSNQ